MPVDPAQPQPPLPSDADLIAAIHSSRPGTTASRHFETLYLRHRDWVYRLALRFCANHNEALDVTQETFIYLLGKLDARGSAKFQLTSKLTTFLYPAVKHIALARRRRKVPRLLDDESLDRASRGHHSDLPAERPEFAELAAVLSGLSGVHREAILMRFVDGMSMEEMSAALSVPVGTIKSRLHNAIAALRDDPRTRRYFLGEEE